MKIKQWSFLVVALFALTLTGCSLFTTKQKKIQLTIDSSALSNNAKVFYVMVKATDKNGFLTDSYDTLYNQLFTSATLYRSVIKPGQTLTADIPVTTSKDFGVYFFFTNPTDRWKVLITQPIPDDYTVKLGVNGITDTSAD
ncbi:hypothetical protein [Piscirickettsia litoralis]|uniref:Type VI lipoprotein IgE-like C-terminal domain-containing protein n=1 Tax=Piscirickettsia litoralis TaxID=1891921 RepID=A0ABX3A152_9GAMM|nr:hypothetical protein [Piscirickettsia litoralis]ODN42210.1 hypothetical protein BGC07_03745 [Piscirickettsia litoralis]